MNEKEKCQLLREIRKEIARINDIVYLFEDCHSNICNGECSIFDAEIKYLENELNNRVFRGEKIILSGINIDNFMSFMDKDNLQQKTSFNRLKFSNLKDLIRISAQMPSSERCMISIYDLDLTVREYNYLKRLGIETLEELFTHNKDACKRTPLGSKINRDINQIIKELDLEFKSFE